MYVSKKDIETMLELSAFVAGALESCDGEDENGNPISSYWIDLEKRVDKLDQKMQRCFEKQNKTA